MMGIDMRNENSAALARFVPVARRVDMVVPLRERPGTTARAWAIPTEMADGYVTARAEGLMNEVRKRIMAVARNENGKIL